MHCRQHEDGHAVSNVKPPPEVMTLSETAEFLRLNSKTVVKLANEKQLPGRRIGRDWRFLRSDLVRFIHGDRAA